MLTEGAPSLLGAGGDHLPAMEEPRRKAMEPPPFEPFDDRRLRRACGGLHLPVGKPLEVLPRQFEIGRADETSTAAVGGLVAPRLLAEQAAAIGELDELKRPGPERRHPLRDDIPQQADDHHQCQRQAATGEPHPGLAMGGERRMRRTAATAERVRAHATSAGIVRG